MKRVVVAVCAVALLAGVRPGRRQATPRQDAEGRHGHGRRRPQRPRLQPPRLRRAPAGEGEARRHRSASPSRARPPTTSRTSPRSRDRATTSCSGSATPRSARWAQSPSASRTRTSRSSTSPTATWPASRRTCSGCSSARSRSGYLAGYLAGLEAKRLPGPRRRQLGRGREAAAGRPLHRRLPGGREEGEPERDGAERLLAGLQRPGEVQGDRAEPDRRRVASRSSRSPAVAASARSRRPAARRSWGIGVDADQSFLGPHILTSATKKVDRAVFLAITSVQQGRFHGGDADLRAEGGRRRPRQDQRQGARIRGRQGQADPGAADRREDRPTEDRPLGRGARCRRAARAAISSSP